jgi:hypothetical protein
MTILVVGGLAIMQRAYCRCKSPQICPDHHMIVLPTSSCAPMEPITTFPTAQQFYLLSNIPLNVIFNYLGNRLIHLRWINRFAGVTDRAPLTRGMGISHATPKSLTLAYLSGHRQIRSRDARGPITHELFQWIRQFGLSRIFNPWRIRLLPFY